MKADSARRRVLPPSERRQQIIEAVFHVVSEYGIPATTVGKVADRAGVGIGTIYRYFDDQKAMLRAAVQALSEQMTQTIYDSFREDALDHIRQMAENHYSFVSSKGGRIARLWMEFVAANPRIGLQDTVVDTQRRASQAIREVCERGIGQGAIRADADVDLIAYRIFEQAWGVDMSILMGLNEFLGRDCPAGVLDELLDSIAADPVAPAGPVPTIGSVIME